MDVDSVLVVEVGVVMSLSEVLFCVGMLVARYVSFVTELFCVGGGVCFVIL